MQKKIKAIGKTSLLTLIVGALLLGGFRLLYPNTDVDAAPITLIIVMAIIFSSLIELIWQKTIGKGVQNEDSK